MTLLWGGHLSHKLITLSCSGLILGASIAGLVYDSRHDKKVINLVNRFGTSISSLFTSAEKPEEKKEEIEAFSIQSLGFLVTPLKTLFVHWIPSFVLYLPTIFKSLPTLAEGTFNFFKSFSNWNMVKRLFGELDVKFSNFFDFFNKKEQREAFTDLFKGDQLEKTMKTAKLLFGDPSQEVNKYFKISSNLFTYVLLRFLRDPSKITKKFKRFSGMFDRIFKKTQEEPASSTLKGKGPYSMDIAKMSLYLGVKEGGCGEAMFENTWENNILHRAHANGSELQALKQTQQSSNSAVAWSQGIECSTLFGSGSGK